MSKQSSEQPAIYIQPEHQWLSSGGFQIALRMSKVYASFTSKDQAVPPEVIKGMVLQVIKARVKYPFWVGQIRYTGTYEAHVWTHTFWQRVGVHIPPPISQQQQSQPPLQRDIQKGNG